MSDPYKVLGVSRNATDADQAAEKFTQVQQAYQQIMDERKLGGASYGTGYGYGGFEGSSAASGGSNDEYALHIRAAANYINTRHFREALNVLSNIPQRTAQWYYLSALANAC